MLSRNYSDKAYEGNDFSPPAIKTERTERLLSIYVLDQWHDVGKAAEAAANLYETLIGVCDRLFPCGYESGRLASRASAMLTATIRVNRRVNRL